MKENRLKKNSVLDNIFCFILFLSLVLPNNDYFLIKSIGITLKSCLFLFLIVLNLLGNKQEINPFYLDKKIIIFFLLIFFGEIIMKPIIYNETINNGFKSFYLGIPLLLSLSILFFGLRIDIKKVWNTLLFTIVISILLSVILYFYNIPFLNQLDSGREFILSGRIHNANVSFGLIAFFLLLKYKNNWFAKKKFYLIIIIASLLLAFNRTFLGLILLLLLYLIYEGYKDGNVKMLFRVLLITILFWFIIYFVYISDESFSNQINSRILYLFDTSIKSNDRLFENNRDVIYEGILSRIDEGYWLIGLPFTKPIFINFLNEGAKYTDTSLINILLRFGFFPMIILILIFIKMYKKSKTVLFKLIFITFLLASFNIDTLYRHNSIFFLTILFYVDLWTFNNKEI
ncbi:hypothetical protein [Empedobacter sp. UBA7248]|uniref:hypothetical protein n=1 Tax=Empedobacter sp. UBA7248 TaxID=1946448 RepID=UPI0025C0C173|nr:hypothetical protein [Empedobacter sp. UBA7248]